MTMRAHSRTASITAWRVRVALLFWLLLAAGGLLGVATAFAQSGSVMIDDPDNLLADRTAVEAAAERLAAEGADVVVVAVEDAGAGPADAQAYLDNRLDQLGVASDARSLRGNQIVFYVAPRPGFDGIYYVPRWKQALDPVYRTIGAEQMRPRFTSGDFGGGMIAGIDAVRTTINPPASPLPWVVGGVLAVGAASAVAAPVLRKRRAADEALASARKRMEQARAAAGVALADLGRNVNEAREKAQFDRVSYSPHDVARLAQLQQEGETQFADAQAAFDAAEEAQIAEARPTAEHYDAVAARFAHAQQLAAETGQMIGQVEQLRADLDRGTGRDPLATQRLHQ
jgi:hypothetical protein